MTGHEEKRIIFSPFIGAFGGVERLILALCRHLHDRGHPVEVLCFQDTIDLASHASWPLEVSQLRPARNSATEAWSLARRLSNEASALPVLAFDLKGAFYSAASPRPFVIHLTDPPSLLPVDISRRARDAAPGPRGWLSAPRRVIVHGINRFGVRKARAVLAMTEAIAREIGELYGVSPKVIRPGVPVAMDSRLRSTRQPGQPLRLLSVSRLEVTKRIEWILNALAQLAKASNQPVLQLDIVGDGPDRDRLTGVSAELRMQAAVTFHGVVDQRRLESLYEAADVFLMPAVQGYGLPALESLVRSVPVVVHEDSGVSEILGGSPWVEIVRASDGSDLADAIRRMTVRVTRNELHTQSLPSLPTESGWADSVCRECGWL